MVYSWSKELMIDPEIMLKDEDGQEVENLDTLPFNDYLSQNDRRSGQIHVSTESFRFVVWSRQNNLCYTIRSGSIRSRRSPMNKGKPSSSCLKMVSMVSKKQIKENH